MGKIKIECFNKKIKLRKVAKAVYKTLGQISKFKVELVFQDGDGITALNKTTRNVDSITDVLSYPSLDGIKCKILKPEDCPTELEGKYIFLGSIVLCEEKIKEQDEKIKDTGCEVIECVGHEQYAYPHYFNYLPDYFDRLEAETHALYEIANEARSKGLDVETKTEVPFARVNIAITSGPASVGKPGYTRLLIVGMRLSFLGAQIVSVFPETSISQPLSLKTERLETICEGIIPLIFILPPVTAAHAI